MFGDSDSGDNKSIEKDDDEDEIEFDIMQNIKIQKDTVKIEKQ